MENTVTISLKDFESLKSKADILDSNTVYFCYKECMPFNNWIDVKTNDPKILEISKNVEDFFGEYTDYQKMKLWKQNKANHECVYGEIQKVKKMSILQFIKWKRKKS